MSGENFRDIAAFLAVARERSFTRAAARLGVSQSALSHTIRTLEARLGLRLLTRTTRSVSPTEAGERLMQRVGPRFDAINKELAAFDELRDKPVGSVRITASDFALKTVLWPKLSRLHAIYPDVKIEITVDPGLSDMMADRYDAGVRFGNQVGKNISAVRISDDIRMAIVAAPSYIAIRPAPQSPPDLHQHHCINLRGSTQSEVYAWELRRGEENVQVRVEGMWTFNGIYPAIDAAIAGCGLAYMPEELAKPGLLNGTLQPVLEEWWPTFPGLHIYYADRQQSPAALSLVVETLRYNGKN